MFLSQDIFQDNWLDYRILWEVTSPYFFYHCLSHCCHIFSWLCAWGGCTIIFIHTYIYIQGKLGFLSFIILCCLRMCADDIVHYDPMVAFVCLLIALPHYQSYADLSESIELLKCLSGAFFLDCVSKIKPIISIIFHAIYGAVCIQLIHSLMMIVRLYYILLSSSNRKNDPFSIV